jgi:hypothetical protein
MIESSLPPADIPAKDDPIRIRRDLVLLMNEVRNSLDASAPRASQELQLQIPAGLLARWPVLPSEFDEFFEGFENQLER